MTDTQTPEMDPLANTIMTLKFSVGDINGIINAMNEPFKTPVTLWANIIANIQSQCAPQIDAINANSETTNESQTAS
jgi:hypothetical protein